MISLAYILCCVPCKIENPMRGKKKTHTQMLISDVHPLLILCSLRQDKKNSWSFEHEIRDFKWRRKGNWASSAEEGLPCTEKTHQYYNVLHCQILSSNQQPIHQVFHTFVSVEIKRKHLSSNWVFCTLKLDWHMTGEKPPAI